GAPAVGGIDGAVEPDEARIDGALRNLIGRVPGSAVAHRRDIETVGFISLGVAENAVRLVKAIRIVPGTVVVLVLEAVDEAAGSEFGRAGKHGAAIAIRSSGE